MKIPNLAYIRGDDPRYFEAFKSVEQGLSHLAEQSNATPGGETAAPPPVNAVRVTGGAGIFDAAITDNGGVYRGIHYFLEHSDSPGFENPHVIHLGTSRNWRGSLGQTSRHWRAYSSYDKSPPSPPVYHPGGSVSAAGGAEPDFQPSQGSGTAGVNQGGAGFGTAAYRGTTAPVRR